MISTSPYKGTKDYFPEDMLVLNYIFKVWKQTCLSHGFLEYQTPIIENIEIYEAKSGEDVGNKELFRVEDLAGRKICLRPEMTPSVTRIVASKYKEFSKPIKLFSIGTFYRQEKPQKGRMREFWQLNADIFGEDSQGSDLEILTLALDIMKNFKAPAESFIVKINHRKLLNGFLEILEVSESQKKEIVKWIDKMHKVSPAEFKEQVLKIVGEEKFQLILRFLKSDFQNLTEIFPELAENQGIKEMQLILDTMYELKLLSNIEFSPSLVRGFEYYDGMVFEVFDQNQDNPRSLFGGGRYNGLANIFGSQNFPAVGFAPGNETMAIFLENWNLIPEKSLLLPNPQIYIFGIHHEKDPLLNQKIEREVFQVASKIRENSILNNKSIFVDSALTTKSPSSGLDYASKKQYQYCILIGSEELEKNSITLKNMETGQQMFLSVSNLISYLNNHAPNEDN